MSPEYNTYKFGEFEIDVEEGKLLQNGEVVKIEDKPYKFLLLLVKNAGNLVEKQQILNEVWNETNVTENSLTVAVSKVRKILNDTNENARIVKNEPKKGYRFIAEVSVSNKEKHTSLLVVETSGMSPNNISPAESVIVGSDHANSYFQFIIAVSTFYGGLFGVILLLESAYKFENFTPKIYWQSLILFIWNSAAMFCALTWTQYKLQKNKDYAFIFGIAPLLLGVGFSYLLASYVLPDVPITLTRFQSQPALAAFLKNEFYIVLLGITYCLTPFYAVCCKKSGSNRFTLSTSFFFGSFAMILAYHVPSTFYLTDNLLPSTNHGFFVRLVLLRSIIYFGLGISSLIWYLSQIGSYEIKPNKMFSKLQFISVFIWALLGFGLFLSTSLTNDVPKFNKVEIVTDRNDKNELFVSIDGENFKPEIVTIRVISSRGEGCPSLNPCTVDNGALKKHSRISGNKIDNVPLTLPTREFYLYVQNGDLPMSNPIILVVP